MARAVLAFIAVACVTGAAFAPTIELALWLCIFGLAAALGAATNRR